MTNQVQDLIARIQSAPVSELFGAIQTEFGRIGAMSEREVIPFFRTVYLLGEMIDNADGKRLADRFAQAAWDRIIDIRDGMDYEDIRPGLGGEIDEVIKRYSKAA